MSSGYDPIDNYEVANFIAGGGTSQVFEVIEPGTKRHLAMKLIVNDHPDAKEHKQALKSEASICKSLDHPNVIHYEGFTNGRDFTYMVMEYFRAPTLKVQLKLDVAGVHLRMKKLIEGICGALQHVHDRGFIHRDIKPENVLMNKVGEIRLIDFSLASRAKSGLAALFGGKQSAIQGTRTYIAPETIRKQQPVLQTDLYSFGILLFEVLTGRTPFQAPTPNELLQKHLSAQPPMASEFNSNVTPEMDRLISKLLSKKPEQRGKDMAEIAAELRRIRVFKEEIQEEKETKADDKPASLLDQLSTGKLDSRLDAQRSEMVRNNPGLAQELAEKDRIRKEKEAARKAQMAKMKIKPGGGAGGAAPATSPPPPQPTVPPAQIPMPYPPAPGYPPTAAMMPPGYPPMAGFPAMPGYPPQPGGYPGMVPGPPGPLGVPAGYGMPNAPAGLPPQFTMPSGMPQGPAPTAPLPPTMPAQAPFPNSSIPVTIPAVPPGSVGTPNQLAAALMSQAPSPPPNRSVERAPPAQAAAPAEPDLDFMTELPDVL